MESVDPAYEGIDAPKFVDFFAIKEHETSMETSYFDIIHERDITENQGVSESNISLPLKDSEINNINLKKISLPVGNKEILSKKALPKKRATNSLDKGPTNKKVYLTKSITPNAMKKKLRKNNQVDYELEKIEALKKEAAKIKMMSTKSLVVALKAVNQNMEYEHIPPTKPKEFKFATDDRIKAEVKINDVKEVDFVHELRRHKDSKKTHVGPTIVKPFSLHESTVPTQSRGETYKPLAELVDNFSKKTPDRFHKRSIHSHAEVHQPVRELRPTIARTPKLETKHRKRDYKIVSQQEKDEMELEEIKNNQFKAIPMNKKIFEIANIGVKKVLPKPTTVIESFDLELGKRFVCKQKLDDSGVSSNLSTLDYQFKAKPCPTVILHRITGINPPKKLSITNPETPLLMKRSLRNNRFNTLQTDLNENHIIKAKPLPKNVEVFQPAIEHRKIESIPFSFEIRDKERKLQKDEKIKDILEKENRDREFFANPLPDLEVRLPAKTILPITKVEPFDLESDKRGLKQHEEWQRKIAEEERLAKEAKVFRARPAFVLDQAAFVPEKKEKQVTVAQEFHLHTETRAEKWRNMEQEREQKEREMQEEQAIQEQIRLEEEARQLRQLRSNAVTKANPVRKYKPVEIQKSEIHLTEPKSPDFSDRLRQRNK